MSKPNNTEIPNSPYGPAIGVPSPEQKNEAIKKDSHYTGASTPGTADHAYPQHAEGGAGHDGCGHE